MRQHLDRIEPGPGQESVWDYPRPPALESVAERLRVFFAEEVVAETIGGWRVLETSHPPVYYFPPGDVRTDWLVPAGDRSWCEFKGVARYWSLVVNGARADRAVWSYPEASGRFAPLAGCFAFYPSRVDACWIGDEQAVPQAGDFYGGWITSRVVGPFKGAPGTRGW